MVEESSTFITDNWASVLAAFHQKLIGEGFTREEALELVKVWFSNTTAVK
jgi:hypothetical protein